jgi:hypothetical protein
MLGRLLAQARMSTANCTLDERSAALHHAATSPMPACPLGRSSPLRLLRDQRGPSLLLELLGCLEVRVAVRPEAVLQAVQADALTLPDTLAAAPAPRAREGRPGGRARRHAGMKRMSQAAHAALAALLPPLLLPTLGSSCLMMRAKFEVDCCARHLMLLTPSRSPEPSKRLAAPPHQVCVK